MKERTTKSSERFQRGTLAKTMLPAVCLLVLMGGAFAVLRPVDNASAEATNERESEGAPGMTPQGQGARARRQFLRVWIHGDDIYPDAAHARPGKILLRAENETISDISLVVERVTPGQGREELGRVKTVRQGKRASQELNLGVGEYVYYEESRPEVRGKLIVAPR